MDGKRAHRTPEVTPTEDVDRLQLWVIAKAVRIDVSARDLAPVLRIVNGAHGCSRLTRAAKSLQQGRVLSVVDGELRARRQDRLQARKELALAGGSTWNWPGQTLVESIEFARNRCCTDRLHHLARQVKSEQLTQREWEREPR